MCDCTSEDDNEPCQTEVCRPPPRRAKSTAKKIPSCDCTSEDDNEPTKLQRPPTSRGRSKANKVPSCDCTSEDSEPKVKSPKKLKSNAIPPCDCTSEDDSDAKVKAQNKSQSNAVPPCDCTSEDDSSKKSCDCTSDDTSNSGTSPTDSCDCTSEDSLPKLGVCEARYGDQNNSPAPRTNYKSPFAIVQVELSKSVLDLLSSESSSTSCDCKTSSSSDASPATCTTKDSTVTCDCTSETASSESTEPEKKLECTLAIIKPEAVRFRKQIETIIAAEGFVVRQSRLLQMRPEQASEFYRDNDNDQRDFARLVAYMSGKPIVVLVLHKLDAIREWRMLIGPTKVSDARVYTPDSIRGKYGVEGDDMQNAVHGSFDERAAEWEIHFFFPDCILDPILRDEAAEEYLWKKINGVLSEGLVKCCEAKPDDPVVWLGNWLLDTMRPKYLL